MHILTVDMTRVPMNIVFRLRDELRNNLEHVRTMRRLTLDPLQPDRGLSGTYGLFGSREWWNNIALGKLPLQRVSGKVERFQLAGPDRHALHVLDIRALDGSLHAVDIHAAGAPGLPLLEVGQEVSVLCALDGCKRQPAEDGERHVARIALEMAVSLDPATKYDAGAPAPAPCTGEAQPAHTDRIS